MVFVISLIWLYKRAIKYFDRFTSLEWVQILSFGGILTISITFLTLLVTFQITENQDELGSWLGGALVTLLIVLILYPLSEFLYFAGVGTQASENYHRVIERLNDGLGSHLPSQRIGGLLLFGGVFFIPIFLLTTMMDLPLLHAFLLWCLIYPTIILGYYAALGMVDFLRPAVYLREYNHLGTWLSVLALVGSFVSVITYFFNFSFVDIADLVITTVDSATSLDLTPLLVTDLLLIVPLLLSIILTVKGFYGDYWAVKPKTRLFDYLFSSYLLTGLIGLLFINLVTSTEDNKLTQTLEQAGTWVQLESNSRLFEMLGVIQNIVIVLWICSVFILSQRYSSEQVITYLMELFSEDVNELDREGRYSIRPFKPMEEFKHLQKVRISDTGMLMIPFSLEKLKKLQGIDISGNRLGITPQQLEESIKILCNLKDLQQLNLGFNELSMLPPSINKLRSLKVLDLYLNSLTTLPEPFGNLNNLERLYIGNNRLTTLPESFSKLKTLKDLNLEHNSISVLPDSFGELESLQYLNLRENQLTTLPESFKDLRNLKGLNLFNSALKTFPEGLTQLTNLEHLELWGCQIMSLPETISNLKNLEALGMGWNQLRELPKSFKDITNLQSLNLKDNQFITFPEPITYLKKLLYLDLGKNRLTTLPESLGSLINLQYLDLSYNRLTLFPEIISRLNNLQNLFLDGNRLSKLPESIDQLNNLQYLVLNDNQLTTLPGSLTHLKNLIKLEIKGNAFQGSEWEEVTNKLQQQGCQIVV